MPEKEQAYSDSSDYKNDKDTTNTYYWKLVFFGALAFLALIFVSVNLPYLKDRAKFFTENALSLSILIAVIVQAIISNRQWKAMDAQLAAMRRQAWVTELALVISNRASVGVHSIEYNKTTETILIKIENIGLVPAKNISLFLEVLASMDVEFVDRKQGIRGFMRFRLEDIDYGSTQLLRGNLQITKAFHVMGNIHYKEIELIDGERGNLWVRGRVGYEDGFIGQARQQNEFLFHYTPAGNFWTAEDPVKWGAHFDMLGPADNEYVQEERAENEERENN